LWKNSQDLQDALIEDNFRYNDLSRVEADDILMNISEILKAQITSIPESGQYGKYPYRTGFCRIGTMKVFILY
jgi:hypothetical protein